MEHSREKLSTKMKSTKAIGEKKREELVLYDVKFQIHTRVRSTSCIMDLHVPIAQLQALLNQGQSYFICTLNSPPPLAF